MWQLDMVNFEDVQETPSNIYNIVGLISEVSEEVATQIVQKLPSSTTPLSFEAPAKRKPHEHAHILYFQKLE